MPRTKRPVASRKVDRTLDPEEAARRQCLEDIVVKHKKALDLRCEMEVKSIKMAFKILLNSLGEETMNKTLGQMKSELLLKERPPSTSLVASAARSPSHDDGYLTETSQGSGGGGRRPRASRSATRHADRTESNASRCATADRRRTRSAEQRGGAATAARSARPTRPPSAFKRPPVYTTPSIYKTPAYNKSSHNNFPPITPKVTPNTPLTVLRRPRQGEMVVSMSGSPLMVPTMNADSKANCNIPLYDGTMLSLQPEHLRKSSTFIPLALMDEAVLKQLRTLKDNLETMVQLGEQHSNA